MQLRSQTREKALNFSCEGGDGRTSSIGGTQACDGNIYLKVDLAKQQKCFFLPLALARPGQHQQQQ